MLNDTQKADLVRKNLQTLEGEYRREMRPHMADRIHEVRTLMMAQPELAAKLYDIIKSA